MTLEKTLTPIAKRYCDSSSGTWRYVRYIDEGNSAAVFCIEGKDGPAALKMYAPVFFEGDEGVASLHRVEAHKGLKGHDCPCLIEFYDAGPFENTAFVLMEYVPWGELAGMISDIMASEIPPIIEQLAFAARFLEEQEICHRDIKPENIILSEDHKNLKLLDLGILRSTTDDTGAGSDDDGKKPFLGTVQYSSPEYLLRKEKPGPEGFRGLTFYQIGGVLHDLIMKKPLFAEEKETGNKHRLHEAVLRKIPLIKSSSVKPLYISLARDCLEKDPDRRLALVNWDRFNKEQDPKKNLEAAKVRYGLHKNSEEGISCDNVRKESHRLKLINVARKLDESISSIRQELRLPPMGRSLSEDLDRVRQEFRFVHTTNVEQPIEVSVTFEITARVGDDRCEINMDSMKANRRVRPIGAVAMDSPHEDIEMIRDVLAEALLEEYVIQLDLRDSRSDSIE